MRCYEVDHNDCMHFGILLAVQLSRLRIAELSLLPSNFFLDLAKPSKCLWKVEVAS